MAKSPTHQSTEQGKKRKHKAEGKKPEKGRHRTRDEKAKGKSKADPEAKTAPKNSDSAEKPVEKGKKPKRARPSDAKRKEEEEKKKAYFAPPPQKKKVVNTEEEDKKTPANDKKAPDVAKKAEEPKVDKEEESESDKPVSGAAPEVQKVAKNMDDLWVDCTLDMPLPAFSVRAMGRALKIADARFEEQCVAVWYMHGHPVFGRAFNKDGKCGVNFTRDQKVVQANVGTFQILCQLPAEMIGFKYKWRPVLKSRADSEAKGWRPIKIGDAAPCVVKTADGEERLGMINLMEEKVEVGNNDKGEMYTGAQVNEFMMLFRKP